MKFVACEQAFLFGNGEKKGCEKKERLRASKASRGKSRGESRSFHPNRNQKDCSQAIAQCLSYCLFLLIKINATLVWQNMGAEMFVLPNKTKTTF